jgi:hypothetical protein
MRLTRISVLMQGRHPIVFESKKLSQPERLYSIYDKEMMAIMHALAKFRQYLVGSKFVVKIDHNSLKYFLEHKDLSGRQQKCVTKVHAFDFDIEYDKGKKNIVADALSRRPATCSLMEISAYWKSHLLVEYSKNKFACEVLDGQVQDDRYRVIDDVIFYKDIVYLVPDSGLKKKILTSVHDSPLADHPGFFKTYRKIGERFLWKGLKQDVMRCISECVTYHQNKSGHTLPTEPLQRPTTSHSRVEMGGLKQDVMRCISECVTCHQNKSGHTLPTGPLQRPTTSHSRVEMGEHIDGLHHRATHGPG